VTPTTAAGVARNELTKKMQMCILGSTIMEIAFLPAWILRRLSDDRAAQVHLNILISCSSLLLIFLLIPGMIRAVLSVPHVCLMETLLQLPCPACGLSASLLAAGRLDLPSAWSHHPVGPFLVAFVLLQLPARLIALQHAKWERCVVSVSQTLSRLLVAALLVLWVGELFYRS
jgi:hypothetical protein